MNDTTFCTTPVLESRPYVQCYELPESLRRGWTTCHESDEAHLLKRLWERGDEDDACEREGEEVAR